MKKVVIKLGSSVIAPGGKFDTALIGRIAREIITLEDLGYKTVIVSSGAVACGLNQLGFKKRPADMPALMALSSVGQIVLMDVYKRQFHKHDKFCSQILLTWDDFEHRKRFLNARHTLEKLFLLGVVPVINENDTISFDEIRFGDNDRLSALVSDLVSADVLIILSNVEGLMKGKEVVKVVPQVNSEIFKLVKDENNMFTRGGMYTKLEAARIATSAGIKVVIACGHEKNVITRIVNSEALGTTFLPACNVSRARKRWIAFSKKVKGKIFIDEGAQNALLCGGRSLLAVGIVKTEGDFKKNDSVEVVGKDDIVIGCGLSNYSSDDLAQVRQHTFDHEVIHRDNFVQKEK